MIEKQNRTLIGQPETVGELKELINDLPDDMTLSTRNTPLNKFWHIKDDGVHNHQSLEIESSFDKVRYGHGVDFL